MHRYTILRSALAAIVAAGLAACGSKSADANIESATATVTVGPENVTLVQRAERKASRTVRSSMRAREVPAPTCVP